MSIEVDVFKDRLSRLCSAWKDNQDNAWDNFTALVIATGKRPPDELRYLKSVAMHQWLFGLEISDIVIVFTQTGMRIVCGKGKKADVLSVLVEPAAEVGVQLKLLVVDKGSDGKEQFAAALAFLQESGSPPVVAGLPKLKQAGAVHDGFFAELKAAGIDVADSALALTLLLSHRDTSEEQNCRKSGFLTGHVMNFAVKRVEGIVDQEKSVKHRKLSDDIQEVVLDPSKKANIKLKADNCDVAYPPVVQSGGKFDLRVAAESDDRVLHDGVVLLQIGAKYNSYCTNICRTLFFNPDDKMESIYNAVVEAQAAAIAALKPGAPLSAAHAACVAALKAKGHGNLIDKLTKNVGYGMGLELREGKLLLAAGNDIKVQPGMVFNVSVGIDKLENPDAKKSKDKLYSIQVADSVLVLPDGKAPELLTRFSQSNWDAVSYDINEEEDADGELDLTEASPQKSSDKENLGRGRRQASTRANDPEHLNAVAERKRKQDELGDKKNQETYKRLTAQAGGDEENDDKGRSVMDAIAYKSLAEVPPQRDLLVQVDKGHEAILVPILGVHVPFHITTVKAINYTQDGDHAYIRIQLNSMPTYEARLENPTAAFIKELSFRSSNPKHAQRCVQEAQHLRRTIMARDKEEAERATLVKQEKLIRMVGRQPFRLPDVWVNPTIGTGKKTSGVLEAHQNGFRFMLPKGDILDVMYSNIRHAFFQPAEKEMITLIHFHLKNPIMVGKKKTSDVQLYTEVMGDTVATLDGRGRSAYDPDEVEEEQRERERRSRINLEFQRFTKRLQELWDRDHPRLKLEWDSPYRELAFPGVSGRSTVELIPTVNCLVQLVEPPYTVISQGDIEIVNLERVGFNLKNFDMVIIFKDFSRDVHVIGSIPSDHLEDIRQWLTNSEIKYFESKMNLQWRNILKTIAADPDQFLEDGGWGGFLDLEREDDEDEEEEDQSDVFEPEESEDDDDSDEDESVEDSEEASEGASSMDSDEEEGKDWDELESEAARADKLREDVEEEEERAERSKRKGGGKPVPPAKRRR